MGAPPQLPPRPAAYTRTAILLHWSIALLLLLATGLALFRETFEAQAVWMISAHKVVGLSVLALGTLRILWRVGHPPPPLPPAVGRREALAARAVHWALYLLMIIVPAAGWLFVSLAPPERPLDYRGYESVPRLPLSRSDEASFTWHEVHELLGFAMLGLVALHVAAVLRHRFFGERELLGRMLEGKRRGLRLVILAVGLLWLIGLGLDFFAVRIS
jgi:cytochrome b561